MLLRISSFFRSRHVVSWRPLSDLKVDEAKLLKGNAAKYGPLQIVDLKLGVDEFLSND